MTAKLLDGHAVADRVLRDVAARTDALAASRTTPGLATVLVGDDAASAGYVRKKHEACAAVGIHSVNVRLSPDTTQDELHEAIHELNRDDAIHGFLIQHPLPSHLDFSRALLEMHPGKDADGLHPMSIGSVATGLEAPIPATPAGVRAMFLHYDIPTSGRHVVVIGRGPTIGRPLSLLLSQPGPGANAAVTVLHSGVSDLAEYTRRADIVVAGVGRPGIVTRDMVREGAVVVSAGITWEGKRLVPDVDESVGDVASWITPRLGGLGVTTVAMLLQNTVGLAERQSRVA
ncbi:MAG: bifunctional 5,10-methylenetetrahydrofolate dehydrogenase/5,10-methenyltetrahydrofolate cyclohydrolase [Gemmatimonadota bacterium]|nr:bifunctional 5,10-methylenetetrahydrofolate dehydrogenase/5,10-methenyltetrahydrofolate cyclohydrolase [Gemmatimonadota bacterium]